MSFVFRLSLGIILNILSLQKRWYKKIQPSCQSFINGLKNFSSADIGTVQNNSGHSSFSAVSLERRLKLRSKSSVQKRFLLCHTLNFYDIVSKIQALAFILIAFCVWGIPMIFFSFYGKHQITMIMQLSAISLGCLWYFFPTVFPSG